MRTRMMASLLAITLGVAGLPTTAAAQDGAVDLEAAKTHYANAEAAMAEGRYEAAAAEYGIAYESSKDPVVFVKIGNAHLAAGKCTAAVVYFKRYLKEYDKVTESSREATQEKIDTCEGTKTADVTETVPEETVPDPEETGTGTGTGTGMGSETTDPGAPSFLDTKPSWKRSAGWISLGATVILGTAGAILAMSGQSREEDLNSLAGFRDANQLPATYEGNVSDRYEQLVEEGERFNNLSKMTFAAAGVTLVTAVTLLILDRGGSAESGSAISLTPVFGHRGGGIAAIFDF